MKNPAHDSCRLATLGLSSYCIVEWTEVKGSPQLFRLITIIFVGMHKTLLSVIYENPAHDSCRLATLWLSSYCIDE